MPQHFPNVDLADHQDERKKLNVRYEKAKADCHLLEHEKSLAEFERFCDGSVAVFNCHTLKMFRQIASGSEIFETYQQLESLRIRFERPVELDWKRLRLQAEIEILGDNIHLDKLHYAALSLDGLGLESYGECTITLRDEMIRHRASCFEGNSALIYHEKHDFSEILRCSWKERTKLCTAKLAGNFEKSMKFHDFSATLLSMGDTQDDDEFVEVHIFGTMTAQTFARVVVDYSKLSHQLKVLWKAVKEKLIANGVEACEK